MARFPKLSTSGLRVLVVSLLAVVVLAGGLGHPASASTDTAPGRASAGGSLLGCQDSAFVFWYSATVAGSWNCSGVKTVNRHVQYYQAGGWSGVITYNGTATWAFCDGESGDFFGMYVNKVNLYATKASWC